MLEVVAACVLELTLWEELVLWLTEVSVLDIEVVGRRTLEEVLVEVVGRRTLEEELVEE